MHALPLPIKNSVKQTNEQTPMGQSWRQQWGKTISTQERKLQCVIFLLMAWRVMPALQSFGAIPPSPDTHSCYQGWGNDSPRVKLTMSILPRAVNSDIVGRASIYGFISVKTRCVGWNPAAPQGKDRWLEGWPWHCQEVTDPGPSSTFGGTTSIHLDNHPDRCPDTWCWWTHWVFLD